ncbi:MAG: Gfo/Idh/MocA family oxidoreductase [Chloroflexi bacterium]|nr:Gfo/Idh/MocA family oxidoreductase [Chloroflexota bacterium]MBI4507670.1 Gfo/Idh/MocA family oxidoreductase [Chloroflexota bacterium]
MERAIRFAVVGCGRMGQRRMGTITAHPGAELVCVADVEPDLARQAAEQFGCGYHENQDELPQRDDVDWVVISVPNRWHLPLAVANFDSGKHVFCEKPLARDPAEAREIVAAARANGCVLKVGSNLRYFPNVLRAKALLDERAIGEPLFLRSWIGVNGWNVQPGMWFADPEAAGGGTFLDSGCHVLDIARWFVGEVRACVGMVQTGLWPIQPLEDNGFGIFETVDGKTISIQSSTTEWNGYMYLEVYGSDGYIRVDSRGRTCLTALGDRQGNEQVFDYSDQPPTSYQAEFADLMRALREGRAPAPSGYDGLRAVEMAWGVYESARTGRRVELPARADLDVGSNLVRRA